jgi:hypothetical protein
MFGHALQLAMVVVVSASAAVASQGKDPADAAAMRKKVAAIVERGEQPAGQKRAPLRTPLVEREINAFFRVDGPEFLPTGVVNPQLTIDQGGKVSARATVDLDKALTPSVFNPLSWLGGRTEVTAAGIVRAENGKGRLELQSATLAGISIPKTVLQQVVSYYTRTPESPNGFNIDEPFELPANIDRVDTARGLATVVQP